MGQGMGQGMGPGMMAPDETAPETDGTQTPPAAQ
jgi:hypothetical protein